MSAVSHTINQPAAARFARADRFRQSARRWVVFNTVGFAGMLVQLAVVALLVRAFGVHYLAATALGVEAAVIHNFICHQRWTWRDRPAHSAKTTASRLMRFHLLNGAVSLAGNLAVTAFCTGVAGLDAVASNVIAIVACSLVNFTASEWLVFRLDGRQRPMTFPIALLVLLTITPTAEAGPGAAALAAWRTYAAQIDGRYNASAPGGASFFALDRETQARGWRERVLDGQPELFKVDPPGVEDGKIHHWIGAIFLPGMTVQSVIDRIQQNAGHESEHYEDVLTSRLVERNGDRLRIFMKLRRTNLITVTYNTEHAVEYKRISTTRAAARSVATKIAELADVGTPREHERSADDDNGFLWRLNAYWRYEAVPSGVIVECESVSLSRGVPTLVRPVANPMVDRVARESLSRTLVGLRAMLKSVSSSQLPVASYKPKN
jgi:putative flippase GtrA